MLRQNVGTFDRVARVVLGIVLLTFGLAQGRYAWWGWLGLIPLATGLAGSCPLYTWFGVSTAGKEAGPPGAV